MPALLTTMSIFPKLSTAVWMMLPAAAKSLTESWFGTAVPPPASISLHTWAAGSSSVPSPPSVTPTSLTTTLRALGGQAEGDVAPDAPTRTCHHRRPAVEKSHDRALYSGLRLLTAVSGLAPGQYHSGDHGATWFSTSPQLTQNLSGTER